MAPDPKSTKVGSERMIELFEFMMQRLDSIDAGIQALVKIATAKQKKGPPPVAEDRELDSRYGDRMIHADPRDWTGPSFKKKKMSQCPPAFLEMYAEMKDYFGTKGDDSTDPEVRKKAGYDHKDAALARGWAKRFRSQGQNGTTPPASATPVQAAAPADDESWASNEEGDSSAEDAGGDAATPGEDEIKW